MKRLLFIFILCCTAECIHAQLTYENLYVDYDSAMVYKNLKVIPIRWKGAGPGKKNVEIISLSNALQKGYITISERGTASTENVHWLRITNTSKKLVFIGSGEIIIGGRQDRMVTKDTILTPTSSDQYIPVMCVEENRWSDKEKKFAYGSFANARLRRVLDQSKNQVLIWKEIYGLLDSSKIKSPTLAYAALKFDKKYKLSDAEYFNYFSNKIKNTDSTIVGIVCMSGEKVIGCDVFDSKDLFYAELESLLAGYIEEALIYGSAVNITNVKVKEYLDLFLKDEESQQEYLKKNGKIFRYQNRVFHITAY